MVKVNNLPKSPKEYIVVRYVENDFWYWGSWDDESKAKEVAQEISGIVLNRVDIHVG